MTLQAFSFRFPPEARLFEAGVLIYKFTIRGGGSFRQDHTSPYWGEEVIRNQEMEDIIRTILGNLDNLQPFSSHHFNVFPYKKRWEGLPKMCSHTEKTLTAYPFVLILYLEKRMQSGKPAEEELSLERDRVQLCSGYEPLSKRCKTDSPLEEAILKELIHDLEAEGKVSIVGLHVDCPHAEGEAEDPGHKNKTEVHPGTSQDEEEEEEEEEEEGEDVDPRRPAGILSRLASHFPFSLLFRGS